VMKDKGGSSSIEYRKENLEKYIKIAKQASNQ